MVVLASVVLLVAIVFGLCVSVDLGMEQTRHQPEGVSLCRAQLMSGNSSSFAQIQNITACFG